MPKNGRAVAIQGIKHYIKGVLAMRDGKTADAEAELAQSLKVDALPAYAKQNLGKLLDPENPSDVVLTIITKEKD